MSPAAKQETESKTLYVALPATLTIDMVEALAGNLLSMPLTGGVQLVIDASQVEVITTPGVQLIVAVGKTLEGTSGSLSVHKSSAAFTQAFAELGLTSLLKAWSSPNV